MNENLPPNPQTLILLAAFLAIYLVYLLRTTVKGRIDLYDFLMLASVALVPALFGFFPHITLEVTQSLGVRYPFVIMFGCLFVIVFIYLNKLVIKLNKLAQMERKLAQEMALLKDAKK